MSSEYGNALYKRMGFEFVDSFSFKGDDLSPRGMSGEFLRFKHTQNNTSTIIKDDSAVKNTTDTTVARDSIKQNHSEDIVDVLEKQFRRMTI